MMPPFLELRNICKRYESLLANDGINLKVRSGDIHALLGENGAGKSTLVKIIYGYVRPDAGTILLNGEKIKISSPAVARKNGIGMIFQHFSLFETLTVAENIALITDRAYNMGRIAKRINEISSQYGLEINPEKPIINLSVGERQRVEIIRCLMQNPTLLIMDEPTSVLTPQECERLFEILRQLTKENLAILYISHKLEEVQHLCSHATILRHGKFIAECDPGKESQKSMAEMMIGKKLTRLKKNVSKKQDNFPVLEIKNLTAVSDNPFVTGIQDINFDVFGGEIFGIAGVSGNGQNMLCALLSGEIEAETAGMVSFNQRPMGNRTIRQRREAGLAYVPEERSGHGAVPELTLIENTLLTAYQEKGYAWMGCLNYKKAKKTADLIIADFNVRTPDSMTESGALSGGNLQKFIVGRELGKQPKLLIVSAPTWGIDAGAAIFVRQKIIDIAATGTAVIIVSQDLDEILSLSNRIAVMFDGSLSKSYPANALTHDQIGLLMGGVNPTDI